MRNILRRCLCCRKGVTALEFALIAPTFVLILISLLEVSLVLWARGVMQLTASQTARCTAINSSKCNDPQGFATSIISSYGMGGIVPSISVSVQKNSTCGSTAGVFDMVTITNTGGLPIQIVAPFAGTVLTISACYPSGP